MPMTKEQVLKALNEGRITCYIVGSAKITPLGARKLLLANLDRFFDPRYAVDLSFEQKYAHLLNADEKSFVPHKRLSHQSSHRSAERQNQRV